MSGLRRALIALAAGDIALGLAALALVTATGQEKDSTAWIVLALTLGWASREPGSSPGGGGPRTASAR